MTRERGHGGTRRGAGRPRKWRFEDMLAIGQACEARWRGASSEAVGARIAALPHEDEIRRLHKAAQAVPVVQRKAWLAGEAYEEHAAELEAWLHKRAGHPLVGGFEAEGEMYGGEYEGIAPRVLTVSAKPPRGTWKRIVGEVAMESGLSESAVGNLWKDYRRFERELRDAQESAET